MKVLCLLLMLFAVAIAVNPGFKTRITQKGLDYANKVAMLALSKQIRSLKIPNQSGKSGKISYDLSNMQIRGFTTPTSSMLLSTSGLRWKASGAGISMHGDFHYKYKQGWIHISDHGSFDASLGGVSFQIDVKISRDAGGKPKLIGGSCSSGIGSVKIHFHGGASWIYNLFSKIFDDKVKKALSGQMCGLVVKAINTDANNQLAKLPMVVTVDKTFDLDYRLTNPPVSQVKYMETFHKGEVYWKGGKESCPYTPKPLPTTSDTSRMMYLWVSEYMGNSLAYTALQHGFLKYNLTAKDLPPANRSLLNTTCSNVKCIGALIPQIGKKYPHSTVKFHMYATAVPVVSISPSIVTMNFSGNIDLYAQLPNGKSPYLLTINCGFIAKVTASLQNQLIKGKITNTNLKVKVTNSTVGTVPSFVLQLMMNAAIDGFVVPTLNAQGQKGLVLPVTKNIRFSNTKLSLLQGAVFVATDLVYSQTDEEVTPSENNDDNNNNNDNFLNILRQVKRQHQQQFPESDVSFNVVGEKRQAFHRI